MTAPDTSEIMGHIDMMLLDANREYAVAAGECEKAISAKDDAWWAVADGRCEKWAGYMDALSELMCWILKYSGDSSP